MPREVAYPFLKGHGTENDFVLLPDHDGSVHGELAAERVRALCDRRRGIGADGVLRVVRDDEGGWFMDYRNADGSTSEMCGNGIRVFAHHLVTEELVDPDAPIAVGTRDGTKLITRDGDLYTVDLGPALVHGETTVSVGERSWAARHVTTGNPHAVAVVDDLADAGPLDRPPVYDPGLFPDGVNIHFVARRGEQHVAMRPYERGSGATRSCGTGAAAVHAAVAGDGAAYRIDVPGGTLQVARSEEGRSLLTGPAVIVARGTTAL